MYEDKNGLYKFYILESVRTDLIKAIHVHLVYRYQGVFKIERRIREDFWFPGIRKVI